jgi:hypothetical protein
MAAHYNALARGPMSTAYASRVRCAAGSERLPTSAARLRFFSGLISSYVSSSVEDQAGAKKGGRTRRRFMPFK